MDVRRVDIVERDISHRLHIESRVSVPGDLCKTRPADAFDREASMWVFERTKVAVVEQAANKRLLFGLKRLAPNIAHHFIKWGIGDELLHVVVPSCLTDQPLRIAGRLE